MLEKDRQSDKMKRVVHLKQTDSAGNVKGILVG
jgi:hypothetical protein